MHVELLQLSSASPSQHTRSGSGYLISSVIQCYLQHSCRTVAKLPFPHPLIIIDTSFTMTSTLVDLSRPIQSITFNVAADKEEDPVASSRTGGSSAHTHMLTSLHDEAPFLPVSAAF